MGKKSPKKSQKQKRNYHPWLHTALVVLAAVSLGSFILAQDGSSATCSPGQVVVAHPTSYAIVTATVPVIAKTLTTTGATEIGFSVTNEANQNTGIGRGTLTQEGWVLHWNTAGVPNGKYALKAHAKSGTTVFCQSPPVPITVNNPTTVAPPPTTVNLQPKLTVGLQPAGWEGPSNVSTRFNAVAKYTDVKGVVHDVSGSAAFHWSVSIGVIKNEGRTASYFSGPNKGTGELRVKAVFNGMESPAAAAKLNVFDQATINSTSTTAPPPTGDTATRTGTAPPPIAIIGKPLDPAINTCLAGKLGEARIEQINTRQVDVSSTDRQAAQQCFAVNMLIPAKLAPVAPEKLKDLPVKDKETLKVETAENRTESQDKKQSSGVLLSGKSLPNADLYIYIFSEPMVLKGKAGTDGTWSYVVENPLKPGKHEVYVAMESQPGEFVRSEPFFINVARAQTSETNPQGNSLQLTEGSARPLWMYVAMVLFGVIVGLRLIMTLRRRQAMKPNAAAV